MRSTKKNATIARARESKCRNAIQINTDSGDGRAFAKLRVLAPDFETGGKIANSPAEIGSFLGEKIEESV